MPNDRQQTEAPETAARSFYVHVLRTLLDANAPFLVGGTYALRRYTGIERDTKDFDIFVRRTDYDLVMSTLRAAGCNTELTFPHWLGKATGEDGLVDVIFSSGNGVSPVDDDWFRYCAPDRLFGLPVSLCPPEEMIWSKAFIAERERYDGADIMHLLMARAQTLDWDRLLRRFGEYWRVLLSHLCLFGFVYPSQRSLIPEWVMSSLLEHLDAEIHAPAPERRICQGTLISREQYLEDVEQWGFEDARLTMANAMTQAEIAAWTRAIQAEK